VHIHGVVLAVCQLHFPTGCLSSCIVAGFRLCVSYVFAQGVWCGLAAHLIWASPGHTIGFRLPSLAAVLAADACVPCHLLARQCSSAIGAFNAQCVLFFFVS
jgi:hypothetical protein